MKRDAIAILMAVLTATGGMYVVRSLLSRRWAPAPLAPAPGLDNRFQTAFTVSDMPAQFEQSLMTIDFPPRTWTPRHAPGGDVYYTLIGGELSTRREGMGGSATSYPAGDAFVARAGEWLEIGNDGDADARVIATALLPGGAPFAIAETGFAANVYPYFGAGHRGLDTPASAVGPTIAHRSSIKVDRPAAIFELVQRLVEFAPGEWRPLHAQGGQELALVVSGAATLQRGEDVEVFNTGMAWVNLPQPPCCCRKGQRPSPRPSASRAGKSSALAYDGGLPG